MKRTGIIQILLITCIVTQSHAQDSVIITQLLQRIEQLQAKESSVFPRGMIPSYRTYALNRDREKADVNAFFTGLIGFTLQDLLPKLSPAQQVIADSIIARAHPVYEKFKNRKGKPTYNFWPTDTVKIFPNSGWLNLLDKKQSLPDDLDDTVIFLLALNAPESTARKVHALMQAYSNNGKSGIKNTYKAYSKIGAYSTWFGEKMAVDFDVCVQANVLYFVQRYQLDWTAADSATLTFIEKVISDDKHMSDPSYVAPQYDRSSVILYHLSRLMSLKPIPALEKLKPQLINDAKKLLSQTSDFMEQCILQTSLVRWGLQPSVIKVTTEHSLQELVEEGKFSFFVADMASMMPNPWKVWLGSRIGKFYYDCDAYNNLLLLENIVLSREQN